MNLIHEMVLGSVLFGSLAAGTGAQEPHIDFARIHRIEAVDTPATFPEITLGVPDGTVTGLRLGAAAGLVAALPVFTESSCAECMIPTAIVFPIWAVGGMLLGGVTGAAMTAAYDPRDYGGNRDHRQDMTAGATIGLAVGFVGIVAAAGVQSAEWDAADRLPDAIMVGLAAPLMTLVGAVAGAIVDASGGDVPCLCASQGDSPTD